MEAHQPLEEHGQAFDTSLPGIVHMVSESTKNSDTLVNWQLVSYLNDTRDGLPHEVGVRIK